MSHGEDVLQGLDQIQIDLMKEECILVDENDQNVGSASKKTCHLLENINKGLSLCSRIKLLRLFIDDNVTHTRQHTRVH